MIVMHTDLELSPIILSCYIKIQYMGPMKHLATSMKITSLFEIVTWLKKRIDFEHEHTSWEVRVITVHV